MDNSINSFESTINFNSTITNASGTPTCLWSSNIDGNLSTDCDFSTSSLTANTHIITLQVTDSGDAQDTNVSILVKDGLVPTINTPLNNSGSLFGNEVSFTSSVDNNYGVYSCSWDSNRDGSLGTDCNFNISSLSVGTHLISLSVTDDLETVTSIINISIILPSCSLPTSTLAAGTYDSVQNVPLTTTTSGAQIRYTINGAAPTSTTGTIYSGPISLSSTGTYTIRAKAFKTGYPESDLFERTYVIDLPTYFYFWGWNNFGQLGDGTTTDRTSPVSISSLSNVSQIFLGGSHSCALLDDGTVKCWGNNDYGQLGDGTTTTRKSPVNISSLSNIFQISLGAYHSCALLNDGTVKCWGYNSDGRLGDGTTTQRNTPVTTNITDVNMISAGFYHTCALINDGTVKCWGSNGYRELGDGTSSNRSNPVSVLNLNDATFLKSSGRHNCVILENKTVKCWGSNRYGQLGDGSTTNRSTPILVNALSDVNSIDVGGQSYSDDGHTCVLLADGTVKCWGHNSFGQLGLVGTTTHRTPTESISNYIFRNGSNFSLYNNFALNDCFKINSNSCVYSNKPDVKNKKIIISYDGSKLSYYLNGELVNNIDEYNILTAENNFILGSQGFKGFISHFSLYKNNLPDNLISTFSKFI